MHPDKPAPTGAVFLAIISILFWFLGFGIYTQAKSAVHEIEALASFIIAAVLLVGAILGLAGTALIIVSDSGENSIVVVPGANVALTSGCLDEVEIGVARLEAQQTALFPFDLDLV